MDGCSRAPTINRCRSNTTRSCAGTAPHSKRTEVIQEPEAHAGHSRTRRSSDRRPHQHARAAVRGARDSASAATSKTSMSAAPRRCCSGTPGPPRARPAPDDPHRARGSGTKRDAGRARTSRTSAPHAFGEAGAGGASPTPRSAAAGALSFYRASLDARASRAVCAGAHAIAVFATRAPRCPGTRLLTCRTCRHVPPGDNQTSRRGLRVRFTPHVTNPECP